MIRRNLIGAGLVPAQAFNVAVGVDVIRFLFVAVIPDPALVAISSLAPAHQGRFPDPGIVIVLSQTLPYSALSGAFNSELRSENMITFGLGNPLMTLSVANPGKAPSNAYRAERWVKIEFRR